MCYNYWTMATFFLAVLLSIVQAAPPVPRKAPDNPADASNKPYSQPSPNEPVPSTALPAVNIGASKKDEKTSNPVRAEDAQKPVRIGELPPVFVMKDWTDRAYWAFSGLLVIVGFLQVWLLRRSFRATQPRLHVDRVRAAWFEVGQRPVFFVKVINSGIVAAKNVSIRMKAEFAGSTIQHNSDQVIVIPANSWRESFIVSPISLDAVVLTGCNSGTILLRVSGYIAWGNEKPTEYCYKYYPWPFHQPRPRGLRHFVPCDFDTTITVGTEVKAMMNPMTATLGTVHIKGEGDRTEQPKEQPNKPI